MQNKYKLVYLLVAGPGLLDLGKSSSSDEQNFSVLDLPLKTKQAAC